MSKSENSHRDPGALIEREIGWTNNLFSDLGSLILAAYMHSLQKILAQVHI